MANFEQGEEGRGEPDVPGVLVFPPLLFLGVLAAGLALDWLIPLGLLAAIPAISRVVVGALLLVMGGGLNILGARQFMRSGTAIRPTLPSTKLVTDSVFGRTRNPMYVGGAIAGVGLAFVLASDWILILLVPALIVLHYGVVLREERYLERKFGPAYRSYKASVPRYGWRL